ncbi:MAG: hypothetical protein C0490_15495 [Marivirga sp.]|nr:hypothetical protein [Marivirga sp.]
MVTKSAAFQNIEEGLKPKLEEALICDGCSNALASAGRDEVRFYCKIMHTITWKSSERNSTQVCTDYLPVELPSATVAPQQSIHQQTKTEEFPDLGDFDPETKPFVHPT